MAKSDDNLKVGYFLTLQSFNLQATSFLIILQLWTISKKLVILKVFFSTLWKETKSLTAMQLEDWVAIANYMKVAFKGYKPSSLPEKDFFYFESNNCFLHIISFDYHLCCWFTYDWYIGKECCKICIAHWTQICKAVLYCSVTWRVMCLSIETSFSLIFVPFNFLRSAQTQSDFVFYQS